MICDAETRADETGSPRTPTSIEMTPTWPFQHKRSMQHLRKPETCLRELSPPFAAALVEYLLVKMHEMGTNVERPNLYPRLFKLVFGSVSLIPVENEQMQRSH
uniref:Uncharacterized protein n=1 Tax=Glossina palpalis gambiensis TaxID=67801 RepID=A0A1B0BT10_9MUSC